MERSTVVAAVLLSALALGPAGAAHAGQFGLYGTIGAGVADWENGDYWYGGQDHGGGYWYGDEEHDTTHWGGGMVFDTAVPGSIFGYRIAVGYERIDHDPSRAFPGFDLNGIVIDQDLTFSFSPPPLRFWLGPELRLGFFRGESDADSRLDADYIGLGIGPVFGLDMAIGPRTALSWKAGYLLTAYAGENGGAYDDDSTLVEGHGFLTLAILFNAWGGYPQQAPPPR